MDASLQTDWSPGDRIMLLLLRERRGPGRTGEAPDDQRDIEPRQEPGKLICRQCGHVITEESQRFAMDGSHCHVCTNPAGVTFELGCFLDAPGVRRAGPPPVTEHSWFSGYAWRIVHCAACQTHLGWDFSGAGEPPGFYGLILNRLTGG